MILLKLKLVFIYKYIINACKATAPTTIAINKNKVLLLFPKPSFFSSFLPPAISINTIAPNNNKPGIINATNIINKDFNYKIKFNSIII